MNKQQLLKQYPELIQEIAGEVYSEHIQKHGTVMKSFNDSFCKYKEEQLKPEWEILSFLTPEGSPMFVGKTTQGWYIHDGIRNNWRDSNWLLEKEYIIHSVKRTSDGEVFTVGDKVHFTLSRNQVIKGFTIMPNGAMLADSEVSHDRLNSLRKIIPLLTTEDGVDIFDPASFPMVDSRFSLGGVYVESTTKADYLRECNTKLFSTKEAAEEYILLHKPVLSVNDVMDKLRIGPLDSVVDTIKGLAKSKLQS